VLNGGGVGASVLSGLFFGLAILTREVGVFVAFAGAGLVVVRSTSDRRRALFLSSVVLLSAGVVVAPWSLRNYAVFGRVVPISTNGGINFYIGNNPRATGTFLWVLPAGATWNRPSPQGRFETEASALGYRDGWAFIRRNPGRSFQLIALRAWYLLSPPVRSLRASEPMVETCVKLVWIGMHVALVLGFFVACLHLFRRTRDDSSCLMLVACVVSLTLPYLAAYGATRYQLPLVPFMTLVVAAVALRPLPCLDSAVRSRPSPFPSS
jgi:hypothetical protein